MTTRQQSWTCLQLREQSLKVALSPPLPKQMLHCPLGKWRHPASLFGDGFLVRLVTVQSLADVIDPEDAIEIREFFCFWGSGCGVVVFFFFFFFFLQRLVGLLNCMLKYRDAGLSKFEGF